MRNINLRSEHTETQAWYTKAASGVSHHNILVHALQHAAYLIVLCQREKLWSMIKLFRSTKGDQMHGFSKCT
jgi:hypothetical protein